MPSLKLLCPHLPDDLVRIADRALAKNPRQRFESAQTFSTALSRVFDGLKYTEQLIVDRERLDMIASVSFFDEFTTSSINELLTATTWVQFKPGDVIISEGDIDDTFYVIVSGQAEVSRSGRSLRTLSVGDCFGEVGFIAQRKRDVTVKANSELMLMKVNTALMDQTSEQCQAQYYKAIATSLVKRLSSAQDAVTAGEA